MWEGVTKASYIQVDMVCEGVKPERDREGQERNGKKDMREKGEREIKVEGQKVWLVM